MADLFKLAGRDVRVKEAEIALNVTPTSDATFHSITASNIKNSTLLAADANGKIIPSTISALDMGNASTNNNQVVYNPVEMKKALTGNGSFSWDGAANWKIPYGSSFNVAGKTNPTSSATYQNIFTLSYSEGVKIPQGTMTMGLAGNFMLKFDPAVGITYTNPAGNSTTYGLTLGKAGTVLTTGDKGVANGVASLDSTKKVSSAQLPDTFEQISVVDKTVQYNDNIEVTEIYLSCEGMESRYCWGGIVFMTPGSSAASNIRYYYNYMGQKTELTPTNAAELKNAIDADVEPIMVSIFNSESNPTITYIPNGLVEGRCYASSTDGDEPFHFYWYGTLTNYLPQLLEIAPDTSKFLDKGTASTTATQTVYNPVELKKPLVVPSIQSPKYTDKSGAQHSLFELGGTHSVNNGVSSGYGSLTLYRDRDGTWDSTSISYTLAEGLKIGDYGVGGPLSNNGYAIATKYLMTNQDRVITQDINGRVRVKAGNGVSSDDFVFESVYNGKLHSKMSVGPSGLVTGGWCIDDKKIATVDVVRSTRDTLADHITAQAGGWIWLGKVTEKTYSLDLSEIKPGESGTTTGATCYVSINTFQQTIEDATQYKTVIDATCRCGPFELKPFPLSNVGSKWFMPRMFISRDLMASDAFTHMMDVLYEDRGYVGMTVDECSVFRDMSTALSTLNASGSISPIYSMNEDTFILFATIMELDRDNENQNIPVFGAHYRVTIFHPHNIL